MKFDSITVCLDMYGCPNRCRHCWIGHTPNGNMPIAELEYTAKQFKPFANRFEIFDWYREPDYRDNYKELWDTCRKLSDNKTEHFELISIWRITRDKEYVRWLSSLGVKHAQLTLFGDEETTDFYTGRKGAYKEIIQTIDILINNKISPRIQAFINKDNIDKMIYVENLIKDLDLDNRCKALGGEFSFFLHQGSCDGENEKFYDVRVTPDDIKNIPKTLADYTLKYFCEDDINKVFGVTEAELYDELINDNSTESYVENTPVFYVDKEFNVYPNLTSTYEFWCLGNLKTDGVEAVLNNYIESKSVAQSTGLNIPICDLVKKCGNPESQRLFSKEDYIIYLLNKYCRTT